MVKKGLISEHETNLNKALYNGGLGAFRRGQEVSLYHPPKMSVLRKG